MPSLVWLSNQSSVSCRWPQLPLWMSNTNNNSPWDTQLSSDIPAVLPNNNSLCFKGQTFTRAGSSTGKQSKIAPFPARDFPPTWLCNKPIKSWINWLVSDVRDDCGLLGISRVIRERRNSSTKCEREDSNHDNTIEKMKYYCPFFQSNIIQHKHSCQLQQEYCELIALQSPSRHQETFASLAAAW